MPTKFNPNLHGSSDVASVFLQLPVWFWSSNRWQWEL